MHTIIIITHALPIFLATLAILIIAAGWLADLACCLKLMEYGMLCNVVRTYCFPPCSAATHQMHCTIRQRPTKANKAKKKEGELNILVFINSPLRSCDTMHAFHDCLATYWRCFLDLAAHIDHPRSKQAPHTPRHRLLIILQAVCFQ